MSVQTIYKCDKCGAEQGTVDQFWTVGVFAHVYNGSLNTYSPAIDGDYKMQVCRKCLEEFGIHASNRPPKEPARAPITLEDLIIELVHETVDSRN